MTVTPVPSVSIVVPAFNNARFVGEALRSALEQTYQDLEVVVADHSSSDGTGEVLARFAGDPRVRILDPLPPGGGAMANWSYVTEQARGEFIKLLPADDVLAPHQVERQVEALRADAGAVLASCRRDVVDVRGETLLRGRGLGPLEGHVPGHRAIRALVRAGTNLLGEPGCVLIRRHALVEVGGWDDSQPYLIDQQTYMRLLERGDLVALTETLAQFRLSDTQWSQRLVLEQSRQVHAVHATYRRRLPDVIRRRDAVLGDARATASAWGRRVVYFAWRRRIGED